MALRVAAGMWARSEGRFEFADAEPFVYAIETVNSVSRPGARVFMNTGADTLGERKQVGGWEVTTGVGFLADELRGGSRTTRAP